MANKLDDVYGEVIGSMNKPEDVEKNTEPQATEATPPGTTEEPAPEATEKAVDGSTEKAPEAKKPSVEEIIQAGKAQAEQMQGLSAQMKALADENAKLKAAAEQSKNLVKEQGEAAKEAVLSNQPKPSFDFNKLNYMRPEEQQAELEKVVSYLVQQKVGEIEGKVKPVLEKYAASEKENAQNKTFEAIANSNKFPGFAENKKSINNIMTNLDKLLPQLANADVQQKYTIAYLIDQGYRNTPKSTDDIVNEAIKNPEVLKKLREKTAKEQVDANKVIPTFSASSSVPATPSTKPKRIEDVTEEWRASLHR